MRGPQELRPLDRSACQGLLVQIPKLKALSSEHPIWSYIQQVTGLRHSREKQGGHTDRQDLRFSHRSHITHTHHIHTHGHCTTSHPLWACVDLAFNPGR